MPVFTDPSFIVLPLQPRVVSLVPSISELLYNLDTGDAVQGITRFCIHPEQWFRTRTRIGGTKDVHTDRVQQLLPDLVIASKEENIKEQVEAIAAFTNVWLTDIKTVDDALALVQQAGHLFGRQSVAWDISAQIRTGFQSLVGLELSPLRTAYLIWKEPWMTVGADTFIHDVLSHAGFSNVFASQTRYPETSVVQLAAMAPELVLLSSEPYPFSGKHRDALQEQLPCVRVELVDGELFSWYGSRLLHTPSYLKQLRERIAHPS